MQRLQGEAAVEPVGWNRGWPLLLGVLFYVVVAGIPYLGLVVSVLVTLLGLGAMWLSLRARTTKPVAPTDVQLNNAIPIDLKLNVGTGKAELNLSGLTLNTVDIAGGAGELRLDLSGVWAQSVEINIEGGVGKVTLRLPNAVGVRVAAKTGLGRVNATGLSKDGDAWVNAAYATSAVVLTITVEAGVGEVNLEME